MPRIGSHVFNVRDFVKETTQTSGTGAYTLDGVSLPEEGHQSFLEAVGDGQKTLYAVKRGSTWEKAIGTVSAGAPVTLSRDLILGTSADDSMGADAIDWPTTDPKDIYIGSPADMLNVIMGPGEVLWNNLSGGNNATALTVPFITTYYDGLTVWFRKNSPANTSSMTLEINGLGAKSLLKAEGVQIAAGEAAANTIIGAVYVASLDDFLVVSGLTPTAGRIADVGDVKQTIRTTAPSGWLMLNGATMGSASSSATNASADYEALFLLMWASFANAQAAVSGGRGASAAADWGANKTITLPDFRGRTVIGSGTGSGLTARTHGVTGGSETGTTDANSASRGVNADGGTEVAQDPHTHNVPIVQPFVALNFIVKF